MEGFVSVVVGSIIDGTLNFLRRNVNELSRDNIIELAIQLQTLDLEKIRVNDSFEGQMSTLRVRRWRDKVDMVQEEANSIIDWRRVVEAALANPDSTITEIVREQEQRSSRLIRFSKRWKTHKILQTVLNLIKESRQSTFAMPTTADEEVGETNNTSVEETNDFNIEEMNDVRTEEMNRVREEVQTDGLTVEEMNRVREEDQTAGLRVENAINRVPDNQIVQPQNQVLSRHAALGIIPENHGQPNAVQQTLQPRNVTVGVVRRAVNVHQVNNFYVGESSQQRRVKRPRTATARQ